MNLVDILWGTPWWVFVLLVYLIVVGVKALKPSEVSLIRLAITPIIFIAWSLYSFYGKYSLFLPVSVLWLIGVVVGRIIGEHYFASSISSFNAEKKAVKLHGSWIPLVLFIAFFGLKYFIGFTYAMRPEQIYNPYFWISDVVGSGLISGIFIGRIASIKKLWCSGYF